MTVTELREALHALEAQGFGHALVFAGGAPVVGTWTTQAGELRDVNLTVGLVTEMTVIEEAFAKLGLNTRRTEESYARLIAAIDPKTEAGRELLEALKKR